MYFTVGSECSTICYMFDRCDMTRMGKLLYNDSFGDIIWFGSDTSETEFLSRILDIGNERCCLGGWNEGEWTRRWYDPMLNTYRDNTDNVRDDQPSYSTFMTLYISLDIQTIAISRHIIFYSPSYFILFLSRYLSLNRTTIFGTISETIGQCLFLCLQEFLSICFSLR